MAGKSNVNHGLTEVLNSKQIMHKYVTKKQKFEENIIKPISGIVSFELL